MSSNSFTRRLISRATLVLALVVSACTTATVTTTTGADPRPGTTAPPATTTTTPDGTTTSTLPDLSGLDLPAALRQQLEDLIIDAQQIRELPFLSTPTITVVDDAGLVDRVQAILAEDLEDLPADEALYKMLGLLPPDADLMTMLNDLYSEQVGGFYDGRTREIVVPAREEGLSILQQGTLVHELVHALTDQHFEFDPIRQALSDEERWDEVTAYRALIEGDATLAEIKWIQRLPQRDLGRFIAESLAVDTTVINAMPGFVRESLLFPYEAGLGFVQYLHNRGGWEAVNDAYRTMPDMPGSTEQIFTPGDFGRDLPVELTRVEINLPGYELVTSSTWGELGLRLMLDQVLGETRALAAADGWGGDYYHQWFDGTNAALVLVYVGDTAADLEDLRVALLDYARAAVADEAFVWVDEEGGLLHFIVADQPSIGERIRSALGLD